MNPIIIYYSKTGFTRQYAAWLAESLNCPCIPYAERDKPDYSSYDTILYGGGFHAGTINGIKWFRSHMASWSEKRLVVFATGATPAGSSLIQDSFNQNFNPTEREQVKTFYLPGGLSYEKMGFGDRLMMKAFSKMLASKKDLSEGEKIMAQNITRSYDISGRDYIKPLLEYLS